MSNLTRKFVAVLMLLWLPLSGGSALAATLAMQAQQGSCHQAAAQPEDMPMDDMGMHGHHDAAMDASHDHSTMQDQSDSSCNACGVCHLAGSGYLAVPGPAAPETPQAVAAATPYAVSFRSITSTPLVPPPLARA
jgi:hypothetical protein